MSINQCCRDWGLSPLAVFLTVLGGFSPLVCLKSIAKVAKQGDDVGLTEEIPATHAQYMLKFHGPNALSDHSTWVRGARVWEGSLGLGHEVYKGIG